MIGLVYRYNRLLEKDMVTVLYLACKETRLYNFVHDNGHGVVIKNYLLFSWLLSY